MIDRQRLLRVIKDSLNGNTMNLTNSDVIILFHWVRNQNDPMYSFVPKKYRTAGGPNEWDIKKI